MQARATPYVSVLETERHIEMKLIAIQPLETEQLCRWCNGSATLTITRQSNINGNIYSDPACEHHAYKWTPRETSYLNWWRVLVDVDGRQRLHGYVSQHPHFSDGHKVTTSIVQELDLPHCYARSLNTEFVLGSPDPFYEATARLYGWTPAAAPLPAQASSI